MVALNCPLCCNETFPTPKSLQCHILNILDNLTCPGCTERFQNLTELIHHLENDCTENVAQEIKELVSENEEEVIEIKHDSSLTDSILARALLKSPECDEGAEPDQEETEYYCQMCDMHFDNISKHLKIFHVGQEVILEEEGPGDNIENTSDDQIIFIVESPERGGGERQQVMNVNNFGTPRSRKLNTENEHEVKDKEGRLYTRKFVKIDKFWLQKSNEKQTTEPKPLINIQIENITDGEGQTLEVKKCADCGMYFTSDEEYNSHKCPNKEVTCSHCFKTFKDTDLLCEHSKTCSEQKHKLEKVSTRSYSCAVCNTSFPTLKSLRLHRRMHEPTKMREIEAPSKYGLLEKDVNKADSVRQMFICKICNKTYDKKYETIHMSSHDSNNGFNCDVCNRKFYTKTNLDMHMKAHSNNKKFTCSYCKKPFVTYDALNDHLLNQCQKRPYACQYCGRRFTRPHEKVKHERIHTGEKPHVCDICGKAFRVSYCLTLHMRTHSGTRPYQCKHCGKRFKSHSVYNHHLLTHSDVRNYKCPYCPKAFKTSVQLAGHKNSHIKPFTCTECNRPFASLYAVRAHMETHKRDNNLKYECWMCGALYSRAFALRDHLKQQHHQVDGEKAKAEVLPVDEETEATNSILVTEDDMILGLDEATNIEIIENEADN